MEKKQKKFIVITTINKKTDAIKKFSEFKDWKIILVGDKKSKQIKNEDNIIFLSVKDQNKLDFEVIKYLPYNHYSRKNIGYLYAISLGADIIYDTDDDNTPYNNWSFPEFKTNNLIKNNNKFLNIYTYFTRKKIWPRGYPLNEINKIQKLKKEHQTELKIGAWQGLADIDPDVDAIYRLTNNKKIKFNNKKPIALNKNTYCPFNSQNTTWNKKVFYSMYLPSTVSFRFTDILRGYIAQRLFWEEQLHLGFTKATVYQNRNSHNLMKDFDDEIEIYLNIKAIIKILDEIKLEGDYKENLKSIYKELERNNYIKSDELTICEAWLNDLNSIIN